MTATTWLGIDVGGTTIKWEQVSDSGETVAFGRVSTPTTGHEAVTAAIAAVVDGAVVSGASGGSLRPVAVGIAVPGHLSPERDSITLLPNVTGEWLGFPIVARLREATGYEPTLLNDARAFAVAELELGAARGSHDVVFVTIGTGIGGALAIDGTVVRSRRDTVGELGHTIAVVDGDLCTCGHQGCVEAYAGGAQIIRRAVRQGLELPADSGALLALRALVPDSTVAAKILSDAYEALAVGVSNACALAGANTVVIGGGIADELPGFLERTRHRLAGRRTLLGDVSVRGGQLGVRAGAVGAALAARSAHLVRSNVDVMEQVA